MELVYEMTGIEFCCSAWDWDCVLHSAPTSFTTRFCEFPFLISVPNNQWICTTGEYKRNRTPAKLFRSEYFGFWKHTHRESWYIPDSSGGADTVLDTNLQTDSFSKSEL